MGYVIATGPCAVCGAVFGFNPKRVPSTSAITGKKEPICKKCIETINKKRVAIGNEPWPVYDDAYKSIREEEL